MYCGWFGEALINLDLRILIFLLLNIFLQSMILWFFYHPVSPKELYYDIYYGILDSETLLSIQEKLLSLY